MIVLLDKCPFRVIRRYTHVMALQPLHTAFPHTLLKRSGDLWEHGQIGASEVTRYRQSAADVFEKI